MPKKSTPPRKSKSRDKKRVTPNVAKARSRKVYLKEKVVVLGSGLMRPVFAVKQQIRGFRQRRPHKSFRRTLRRDYVRSLKMPGYWAFTFGVARLLWSHRRLFGAIVLIYALLAVVFGGMTSQETYDQLGKLMREGSSEVVSGNWGEIGQAGLLAVVAFTGNASSLTDVQQIYLGVFVLMTWLTTVWLLREITAGRKPRLRDGLYSSGSPIVATLLVVVWMFFQLLPFGILALIYAGLLSVGLADGGFGAFLASIIGVFAGALTLYWLTGTFIALIIVTLPGMYPGRALSAAGDIIIGRRIRVFYRLLWLGMTVILGWLTVMVPLVLLDAWLRGMVGEWPTWLPIVPVIAMVMSAASTVWICAYIYLMYRKVVDDDAPTA